MRIRVCDDLAAAFVEEVTKSQPRTVALAGGSTPRRAYERLVEADLPWESMHFFFGDERAVGPDHERSNYRMASEALLSHVPAHAHRIRGEEPPEQAAELYEAELQDVLGVDGPLDLAVLGVGTDGHTASLFPGSPALESAKWVEAVWSESQGEHRITLTLRILNAARLKIVLASGADKADVIAGWVGGRAPELPIARVEGDVLLLLDEAAAAGLEK